MLECRKNRKNMMRKRVRAATPAVLPGRALLLLPASALLPQALLLGRALLLLTASALLLPAL